MRPAGRRKRTSTLAGTVNLLKRVVRSLQNGLESLGRRTPVRRNLSV
jgi:hypothetical protein